MLGSGSPRTSPASGAPASWAAWRSAPRPPPPAQHRGTGEAPAAGTPPGDAGLLQLWRAWPPAGGRRAPRMAPHLRRVRLALLLEYLDVRPRPGRPHGGRCLRQQLGAVRQHQRAHAQQGRQAAEDDRLARACRCCFGAGGSWWCSGGVRTRTCHAAGLLPARTPASSPVGRATSWRVTPLSAASSIASMQSSW